MESTTAQGDALFQTSATPGTGGSRSNEHQQAFEYSAGPLDVVIVERGKLLTE